MANKYPWATNEIKLQRAIQAVAKEQQPEDKKDERIKELYILWGGKLRSEGAEPKVKSNATTRNKKNHSPAPESGSDEGGQDSADDSDDE